MENNNDNGAHSFTEAANFEEGKPIPQYYIQNRDAGFMGNAIVFWRKGCCGYTADLDQSELFSEEDAKRICLGSPKKNLAWPKEYIDNNKGIQRIVDSQYIFSENIKTFES